MARFDDGKDADAMRTIGEVAAALGIKPARAALLGTAVPDAPAAEAQRRAALTGPRILLWSIASIGWSTSRATPSKVRTRRS